MTATTHPRPGRVTPAALRGDPRRHRKERAIRWTFFVTASFSILVSIGIIVSLVDGAGRFLAEVELSRLWADGWFPRRNQFDVLTLIVGSVIVTGIAIVIAAPLGLGAAIFLSEYAKPRLRRILKPILEILAGIPSIVVGYFAIAVLNPGLIQRIWTDAEFFNLAAAGIGVGILTIPLIASVSEDAMRAVPQSLREASYGLGSRKMTTTLQVVVPAALSGISAAMIIGVSRAIGETMVVALAAGASGGALRSFDPLTSGQTMTAAMASLGVGTDQVAGTGPAFQSLYFVGMLLFLLTLGLNVLSARIVRRFQERY